MDVRKWLHGAASFQLPPAPATEKGEGANVPTGAISEEETPSVISHDTPACPASVSDRPAKEVNVSCGRGLVDDLGTDQPNQIFLQQYPACIFSGRKQAFVSTWYHNRDWLEYSVKVDAAFCFCCQQFTITTRTLDAFLSVGFLNWKNAVERDWVIS